MLPTLPEILDIYTEKKLPSTVVEHSIAVAYVAVSIAKCIISSQGLTLDIQALTAGGLLHDVEKFQPNHAARAAELVTRLGYSSLAPMIATHMDLVFHEYDPLNESAILYLADKICKGSKFVTLEKRLEESIQTYGDLSRIRGRFSTAFAIREKVLELVDIEYVPLKELIMWKIIKKYTMRGRLYEL
ncbi:metal-dependent phosphohydrolase HD sub domain containing protein [Clostridium sp. DL-VIII]|uniref:HD domain-containing protein n=1 Tax=Clostridium sp. DL-VIII TaxID=641107 RepID=UPI00023AF357|nr:HD domain-containing protein [Clostridium sp. DL-VIII]EHI97729.1 metal-dependent phosphohydrolase HD sub domain containing protein [Clostridium sp. DL-VIII]